MELQRQALGHLEVQELKNLKSMFHEIKLRIYVCDIRGQKKYLTAKHNMVL